eukprot:CAMPEP_0168582310 /NCGR_PEP_ID=MMETSP0420-20121227/1909_1 /TAXON_ID=498008 /ORGANISM="Pessonella sp." /LENGTH=53 /DNA_ID=CAMNT_0008616779 /DNA_START=219 /DNA_END=377 /DNA_ORIENTATION=+
MVAGIVWMCYRAYIGVERNEITILPVIGNWAYGLSYGKVGGGGGGGTASSRDV